jgi:uncharacterized protein YdeI (YjbR/CyaY-like superfamily)
MDVTPKFFKTPEALRAWFAKFGSIKTELWMGYYKKASGKGGVVYKQALDEALCVGWIDGQVKSVDDICYMQRWTPRKPKSIWSNVNTKRVQELIAAGRMTPAGMAAFERRDPKRSGVYSFENEPLEFSPAFLKRFKADKRAWKFFEAQPPGYRRMMKAYVMTAKQEPTRERRFVHVMSHAAREERIPLLGSPQKAKARPAAKK